MNILRDTLALWRNLPDALARWCDRTVMQVHRPEMVPTDDTANWPNGVMPWCLRCGVAWPCEPFAQASDRLDGRECAS